MSKRDVAASDTSREQNPSGKKIMRNGKLARAPNYMKWLILSFHFAYLNAFLLRAIGDDVTYIKCRYASYHLSSYINIMWHK